MTSPVHHRAFHSARNGSALPWTTLLVSRAMPPCSARLLVDCLGLPSMFSQRQFYMPFLCSTTWTRRAPGCAACLWTPAHVQPHCWLAGPAAPASSGRRARRQQSGARSGGCCRCEIAAIAAASHQSVCSSHAAAAALLLPHLAVFSGLQALPLPLFADASC